MHPNYTKAFTTSQEFETYSTAFLKACKAYPQNRKITPKALEISYRHLLEVLMESPQLDLEEGKTLLESGLLEAGLWEVI